MNELRVVPTVFTFQDHEIREITDANGDPWFIAKDVCDVLGLDHITNALAKVPEHHLTVIRLQSGGQIREMKAVDEPGLYRLVLRSDKPQAEQFMEWVTAEVLPSIRKTGGYILPGSGRYSQPSLDPHAVNALVGVVAGLVSVIERIESGAVQRMIEQANSGAKGRIRYETGPVKLFVASRCSLASTGLTRKTALHQAYKAFCRDHGLPAYGYSAFCNALSQAYPALANGYLCQPGARRQAPVFHGIALEVVEEAEEEVQA